MKFTSPIHRRGKAHADRHGLAVFQGMQIVEAFPFALLGFELLDRLRRDPSNLVHARHKANRIPKK